MPTYEYACKKCGERFDVVQSFDDEPLKKHKGCGGAVRRVFGSVGIAFKGSGFYKNDSRSSTSKSSAPAAEKTETSSDKTETKSETKPETKSERKETKADKKPAKATTK